MVGADFTCDEQDGVIISPIKNIYRLLYEKLKVENGIVKEWEIYRIAGLRKNIDLEVKNYILNLIEGSHCETCEASA